jgi:hypothetical protein
MLSKKKCTNNGTYLPLPPPAPPPPSSLPAVACVFEILGISAEEKKSSLEHVHRFVCLALTSAEAILILFSGLFTGGSES